MLTSLLLQVTNTERSSIHQFVLIGAMLLVFYFFMIRPQQKRRKEQRTFFEKMKKGEPVITIGGIHGKIYEVAADTVTLEIDQKGSKITVAKRAISLDNARQTAKKNN